MRFRFDNATASSFSKKKKWKKTCLHGAFSNRFYPSTRIKTLYLVETDIAHVQRVRIQPEPAKVAPSIEGKKKRAFLFTISHYKFSPAVSKCQKLVKPKAKLNEK